MDATADHDDHQGRLTYVRRRGVLSEKWVQIFRGPVQENMEAKLTNAFNPVHLQVLNESSMHSVPKNSETHFKVVVVSDAFEGVSLLERHRQVNKVLQEELNTGVHALSIVSKTPKQWTTTPVVKPSPACLGGMKREN